MQPSSFLSGGWKRSGTTGTGVVRRACPASGAQWNVQVVRGKVNGKCLWNACKALSVGLLLMILGAAMATIGYYADDLSVAQEIRGNHTVRIKNEARGFHLNNLSYAGPIVMGVGGFIVVAACVMTFEARDSAAKVVPARFKMSTTGPPTTATSCGYNSHGGRSVHGSLRHSGSQTTNLQYNHQHVHHALDRHSLTQSFKQFSRGLVVDSQGRSISPQGSVCKSPSAPNLNIEPCSNILEQTPTNNSKPAHVQQENVSPKETRKGFVAYSLLNASLLKRHAVSVDETSATYRLSRESLPGSGSQGSMALDLHLDCPVTLRVRDRRRNPLRRQQKVEEDERHNQSSNTHRTSRSCSPRMQSRYSKEAQSSLSSGGSTHQLPTTTFHQSSHNRRSSNASDCSHHTRTRRKECHHIRGHLERAISSDSRLTGAIPKCYHRHTPQISTDQESGESKSDTDIHRGHHKHAHKYKY